MVVPQSNINYIFLHRVTPIESLNIASNEASRILTFFFFFWLRLTVYKHACFMTLNQELGQLRNRYKSVLPPLLQLEIILSLPKLIFNL